MTKGETKEASQRLSARLQVLDDAIEDKKRDIEVLEEALGSLRRLLPVSSSTAASEIPASIACPPPVPTNLCAGVPISPIVSPTNSAFTNAANMMLRNSKLATGGNLQLKSALFDAPADYRKRKTPTNGNSQENSKVKRELLKEIAPAAEVSDVKLDVELTNGNGSIKCDEESTNDNSTDIPKPLSCPLDPGTDDEETDVNRLKTPSKELFAKRLMNVMLPSDPDLPQPPPTPENEKMKWIEGKRNIFRVQPLCDRSPSFGSAKVLESLRDQSSNKSPNAQHTKNGTLEEPSTGSPEILERNLATDCIKTRNETGLSNIRSSQFSEFEREKRMARLNSYHSNEAKGFIMPSPSMSDISEDLNNLSTYSADFEEDSDESE